MATDMINENELEEIYAKKKKDLIDYLEENNIKTLYGVDIEQLHNGEDGNVKKTTKYYFVEEKHRDDMAKEIKKASTESSDCIQYEITDFDNIEYERFLPSLCGENEVEFGSISGIIKFKQKLKFIKVEIEG
ncbi:hypothetical protein [Clostridium arbusti]|uniref:hypothetical protein n=1 Tax=Clostridium arbusti TaxID=1137848 RepID=UPI0002896722|nr:hypothetical protein [Clostridium arbusti]